MHLMLYVLVLVFVFAVAAPLVAQKHPVTIDEAFGKLATVGRVPRYMWIRGHELIRFQTHSSGDWVVEISDPLEKARREIRLDGAVRDKFIAAGAKEFKRIPEPTAFCSEGQTLAWRLPNGIYTLSLSTLTVVRATTCEDDEFNVRFAPNGKQFAFVRANNLYVYELETGDTKQLTFDGSATTLNGTLSWVYWEELFGRQDTAYWWSPDSQKIAFLCSDDSLVPISTFVDPRPQAEELVQQHYPKTGDANPRVKLGVLTLGSKTPTWPSQHAEPFEYISAVQWTRGGKLVFATMNRAQTVADLYLYDSGVRKLLQHQDPKWIDASNAYAFISDETEFVWPSATDGYRRLLRYDLSGKLLNKVTAGKWQIMDQSTSSAPAEAVVNVDDANSWVYYIGLADGHLQRQLYRSSFNGKKIERVSQEKGVHAVSFSPDGMLYLDTHSSLDTPTSLRVVRADGKVVSTLWKVDLKAVKDVYLSHEEFLEIPARDGFLLPAKIRKPHDFDSAKRYPVILSVYGGPHAPQVADQYNGLNYGHQMLNDAGYIVITVDPRISTVMSRRLCDSKKGFAMFESATHDLIDVARWLKHQSWVDGDRIGITGWSGGGTSTINCMSNSSEFKAGIAGAPNLDFTLYDSTFSERFFGILADNLPSYEKSKFWKKAKDLKGELLMIWGTYDDNVHPQHEQVFLNACIEAGVPLQTMVYPMRKHGFTDLPARKHLVRTTLKFWKANL